MISGCLQTAIQMCYKYSSIRCYIILESHTHSHPAFSGTWAWIRDLWCLVITRQHHHIDPCVVDQSVREPPWGRWENYRSLYNSCADLSGWSILESHIFENVKHVSHQGRVPHGQEWILGFLEADDHIRFGTLFKRLRELTHRASVPAVVVPVSCPYILWCWITTLLRHHGCDDAEGNTL